MRTDDDIADGPLDAQCKVDHLDEEERLERRALYEKFFSKGANLKTASGQLIAFGLETQCKDMDWVEDGFISVASEACDLCSEINACRPKDSPPFVCLVKARPRRKRTDGTSRCALCQIVRRGHKGDSSCCRARGGKDPEYITHGIKLRNGTRQNEQEATLNAGSSQYEVSDSDGSLFGSKITSDEDEGEDSDIEASARDEEQLRRGVQSSRTRTGKRSKHGTARSSAHRGRRSDATVGRNETIALSDDDDDDDNAIQPTRLRPARTRRPVNRYSGAGQTSTTSAATMTSKPSSIICSNEARRRDDSELHTSQPRQAKQQKTLEAPKEIKNSNADRARLLRQQCIQTAKQLLSLHTAELRAELDDEC